MEKSAICLGLTHDFEFAAGVVLLNFIGLHGVNDFDFMVYSDRDLPKLRNVLRSQGVEVRVIKYRPPIPWVKLFSSRAIGYFSPMVLSKFEAFGLLGNYKRVMWLDYDILLRRPLTKLLTDENFDFAYQQSEESATNAFHLPPPNLDPRQRGMCAHLFVLRDSFPGHSTARESLYEIFASDPDNFYAPEQGAIDLLISGVKFDHFELNVEDYNCLPEEREANPDSIVFHSWGPSKFWNSKSIPEWEGAYDRWIQLGGSNFKRARHWINKQNRKLKFVVARSLKRILG